jgi:UDPglucose 6-dehydrogenase
MAYENPHLQVTVVDRDASRIAQWKTKHLPLYEPGLYEILQIARDGSKAFTFLNEPNPSDTSLSSASSSASECESQCYEHRDEIFVPARQPNLFFSTEISRCISEADLILIAVNTPTKMRGIGAGRATDMTALEAVTREIAIHAKPGAILVEKSTVPCRTAELIKKTASNPSISRNLANLERCKSTAPTSISRYYRTLNFCLQAPLLQTS